MSEYPDAGPMPVEGMSVSTLTRKNRLIAGEIVSTRTDGTFDFFTVEWESTKPDVPVWKVEYNTAREWGNSVYVPTCTICDSSYHNNCEEGW